MTAKSTTRAVTIDDLWRATRDRREARQIAALLTATVVQTEIGQQLARCVDHWEQLADEPEGTVYRAVDTRSGHEYAVKCAPSRLATREDFQQQFAREAATTAALEHAGVPRVHATGKLADQRPFFVMDLIPGVTLTAAADSLHTAHGDYRTADIPAIGQALRLFAGCCRTVAYAHARGVLHCDLKPSNIMFTAEQSYVLDWGAACRVGDPIAEGEEAIQPVGTPAYMSPEQAAGNGELGVATDIYGLGATLYHLLTGRPPIEGRRLPEVVDRLCRGDFPSPREVNRRIPRRLDELCRAAMALQPAARFATAIDLAQQLEAWSNRGRINRLSTRVASWLG